MPLTRAQDEEILEYLLHDVLRAEDAEHPIRKLFTTLDINYLSDFVSTEPTDFFNEQYEDAEGDATTMKKLPRAQASRCKFLRNMVAVIMSESGTVPDINGWRADVTHEKLILYTANPRLPVPVILVLYRSS